MPGTSLSGKAKAGVAYSSLGRVGVTMLMLVRTVILVRLLPVRFGVIQLCFMIVDMATTMGDFGFSAAQIQQKEDVRREQTNTLFAIDLSLKLVLFTVMLASVSTVSEYFREPLLKQVLPPLAAYMVLDCLTAPGFAILTRNMKFGTTARIEFTARVADSVVAIAIALGGGGVWSLVFGRLMASAISGALACSASGWRPSLKIDLQGSKGLVKFGGWLFVRNIFNYLADNVDYFFVGRILGTQQLGYYSKAFEVMRIPQSRLTRAITVVLFPAFARVQDERNRVGSGLRKVVLATSLVAFPSLVGLACVAPEFVFVLFGQRWAPMTVPLQVMCLAGVIHAIDPFLLTVLTALGKANAVAVRRLIEFLLVGAGALVGVNYGIVGVAVAVALVAGTVTFGTAIIARYFDLDGWRDYLRPQLPAAGASVLMACVLLGLRFAITRWLGLPAAAVLGASIALGGASYVGALLVVRTRELEELWAEAGRDLRKVAKIFRRPSLNRKGD